MEALSVTNTGISVVKSVPEGAVLANKTFVPVKSIYDLTIGRLYPELNPPVQRNFFISALKFNPEADCAMHELRPRAYLKRGIVHEQWSAVSISASGDVEIILYRLPHSSMPDRSGESFYSATRALFIDPSENPHERLARIESLKVEKSDLFLVRCTEDIIPHRIMKLILPENYYLAQQMWDLLSLDRNQRALLVGQCRDENRLVRTKDGERVTIGGLFDGAVGKMGYVCQFSFTWPGDTYGLILERDGAVRLYHYEGSKLDNHEFLSAIVLKTLGENGLRAYLEEYSLAPVDKYEFDRQVLALAKANLIPVNVAEFDSLSSNQLTYRARHLLPTIKGEDKELKEKIFN